MCIIDPETMLIVCLTDSFKLTRLEPRFVDDQRGIGRQL